MPAPSAPSAAAAGSPSDRAMPEAAPPAPRSRWTVLEVALAVLVVATVVALAMPRDRVAPSAQREAQVRAAAGSVHAAAHLVRAGALAWELSCDGISATPLQLEGVRVALAHCYPQALGDFSGGILAAANVTTGEGWRISATRPGAPTPGAELTIELSQARQPALCTITYTAATAERPPQVATNVSGC